MWFAKIIHSFFKVSCGEMKKVLRVAALSVTWKNFNLQSSLLLPYLYFAFSGWHCDTIYDQ